MEFSPEDASRSDFDYMCDVLSAVIDAGAGTINIPDTVGYAIPAEWAERIARIREKVQGSDRVVLSVHCHNDLGQAVANSLTALMHGARQVECTINGIGERAGNASLEEIVMALRTRKDFFGLDTRVRTEEIFKTSRLLSHITGIHVQPNKAVVGENAFAHEAGIHQDGVLKEKLTYEIMRPEDIGRPSNKLVLGKHSGRHALRDALEQLGFKVEGNALNAAFKRFKEIADRKKQVTALDLEAIVSDEMRERVRAYAGAEAARVTISTFHALGARILRAHGERLGLPRRFAIYATGDQLGALRAACSEISIDDDTFDMKRLLRQISDWKNRGVAPAAATAMVRAAHASGTRADDYAVLAGTQGFMNHRKKDRLFDIAERLRLPVVFFTEGGGGRPGDTDAPGVAGLDCMAFNLFGGLSGLFDVSGVEQHAKFLTAVATDEVALAHHAAQPRRNLLQDLVADTVAVGIVDLFEVIDINH